MWVQRFATSAAFLLVGAPAWWGHWWSQQMRVRTETFEGDGTGVSERGSRVRRVYLVGVVLAGAVVVVAAGGFAAFLALNWRAAGALGGVRAAVAGAAAAAIVALFWALVHGLMLRSDVRYLERGPAAEPAGAVAAATAIAAPTTQATVVAPAVPVAAMAMAAAGPQATSPTPPVAAAAGQSREYRREELAPLAVEAGLATKAGYRPPHALLVIDGADGGLGARLLAALRTAFPDATLWPLGLNEVAQKAMVGALGQEEPPIVPEGAAEQVAAILAPSDIMIPGSMDGQVTLELAQLLADTPARIILLPPRDGRVSWVAAPKWPVERWVENAVIEAGNVLGVYNLESYKINYCSGEMLILKRVVVV